MTTTSRRPDIDDLVHHAKEPLTPAAGPYGHPFHPMLVTIPIGAWVCSLVFDIATRASGDGAPGLVEGAYWLIAIGVIGAVLAAATGAMDLTRIPGQTRAMRVGITHMLLNLSVTAAMAVNLIWRNDTYAESARVEWGQLVLSAAALAVLSVSGWLGGQLAYRYGVRVADQRDQEDGFAS